MEKMAANTKEGFASLNSGDLEEILIEKDSKNTKCSTETAVKLFKVYLREKELPKNFEAVSASTLDDQLTRFFAEMILSLFYIHIKTIISVLVILQN